MTAPVEALFLCEFLDRVMQMVTTPGNHSCMMLEADTLARAGIV